MMRREWVVRALRTFVQAALGYAAANAFGVIGEGDGLTNNALAALLIASVAAGLAALMNVGAKSSPATDASAQSEADFAGQGDADCAAQSGEDADE